MVISWNNSELPSQTSFPSKIFPCQLSVCPLICTLFTKLLQLHLLPVIFVLDSSLCSALLFFHCSLSLLNSLNAALLMKFSVGREGRWCAGTFHFLGHLRIYLLAEQQKCRFWLPPGNFGCSWCGFLYFRSRAFPWCKYIYIIFIMWRTIFRKICRKRSNLLTHGHCYWTSNDSHLSWPIFTHPEHIITDSVERILWRSFRLNDDKIYKLLATNRVWT